MSNSYYGKNTDVCSAPFRSRPAHDGTKIEEFAKRPIFVQSCSIRALREMNKNGQKTSQNGKKDQKRPFLSQAVSGAFAQTETNIALLIVFKNAKFTI